MIINFCDDLSSFRYDETGLGGEVFAELRASFGSVRGLTESRDPGESIFYCGCFSHAALVDVSL